MVKIRIPATSANVGCGFDTLGIALTMYSTFEFEKLEDGNVEFLGFEEKYCNNNNMVYKAMKKTLELLGKDIAGVRISIDNDVPISRGLGSSATCAVAGIYGAFLLTKTPIDKNLIFNIATEIEGHPDNVSPAIFGGLSASCTTDEGAFTVTYDIDERFQFLALIPNFETSTEEARKVMPRVYDLKDCVYSYSRLGVVLKAFETYNLDLLRKVMDDKIHEPYRKKIIQEYSDVRNICKSIDSVCFMISGSGSTLMNIMADKSNLEKIKDKLKTLEYSWKAVLLKVDKEGAKIL